MGWIDILILSGLGFAAFFATGIDDTVAYAGSYLNNKKKDCKKLISTGIIFGTLIALSVSIFAGSLMARVSSRHLIGGAVLITIGIISITRKNGAKHRKKSNLHKIKEHIKCAESEEYHKFKFIGLGMMLFFATGIDDILAYSNLIMAKGTWLGISIGVMLGTFVSLTVAHLLADKLKKLPHPRKIGGVMIIIIGILLALKIL